MSITTKIQWCDSTINPTMGCDGCELWCSQRKTCYAGMLHVVRGGHNKGFAPTFEQVTRFPGRMATAAKWSGLKGKPRPKKPWLDGLPRQIFVSDMSDALSVSVPFDYLEREIIEQVTSPKGRRHHWHWLTKRPARMAEFSDHLRAKGVEWPENLWAGTSITSGHYLSRIDQLMGVGNERTIRFLSVEPQIESLDLSPWLSGIDWVIQGGESGAKPRPFDLEWARDLLGQCRAAGVPYFLKQLGTNFVVNGERVRKKDRHGGDCSEWPADIRVREMPISI